MPKLSVSLLALALLAVPANAVTKLANFSFTAGGVAAHGRFTLDCPVAPGNCTIVDLTGFFGADAMAPLPWIPIPFPPPPPPPLPPIFLDNELTQPDLNPTEYGFGFGTFSGVFDVYFDIPLGSLQMVSFVPGTDIVGIPTPVSDFEASGTPEPASWAMLVVGFGLMGAAQRGRRLSRNLPLRISA